MEVSRWQELTSLATDLQGEVKHPWEKINKLLELDFKSPNTQALN